VFKFAVNLYVSLIDSVRWSVPNRPAKANRTDFPPNRTCSELFSTLNVLQFLPQIGCIFAKFGLPKKRRTHFIPENDKKKTPMTKKGFYVEIYIRIMDTPCKICRLAVEGWIGSVRFSRFSKNLWFVSANTRFGQPLPRIVQISDRLCVCVICLYFNHTCLE
jgi:hypothetical protein